jgi:hypothetical protein
MTVADRGTAAQLRGLNGPPTSRQRHDYDPVVLPIPGSPAVAIAGDDGTATFQFPPPAAGQVFTGTLSINNAPGSAVFSVLVGGQSQGSWIATNGFGPVQTSQGTPLSVEAFGLQPGVQYECSFVGNLVEGGDLDAIPAAQTSIVQPPNALFLGTEELNPGVLSAQDIGLDTSWRAIWVIVKGAGVLVTLSGDQSNLQYEPLTPPYFSDATLYRFGLLGGVDTTALLAVDNAGSGDARFWWGADLADVDVAVYGTGGGGFPTNYALETGGNLQELEEKFYSFSNGGTQVTYYDSDTVPVDAGVLLIAGSSGTTPGTAVPGNARVLQTDVEGRLVIAPGSVATDVNATIVSPLDGSGWVEVDVKTSVLPTNAAMEAGGNLATLADTVTSVDGEPTIRTLNADANGNVVTVITSGSLTGGEVGVQIDGSAGSLPPFASTPLVHAAITSPLDGSGYVEVDVKTIGTVTVTGTVAANATIVSPVDGSGYVEVDVKAALFVGTEGSSSLPSVALVGGRAGLLSPTLEAMSVTSGNFGAGEVVVAVDGTVGSLPPFASTPSVNAAITSPLDGSGYVEVDVKTIGTVTVTGTVAANATITSPLDGSGYVEVDVKTIGTVTVTGTVAANATIVSPVDGSGYVEVDVKAAVYAAATGGAVPATAVLLGGTDGTDLRGALMDATGQLKVLVENFPSVSPYPTSASPLTVSSGSLSNTAATATLGAIASRVNYVAGFSVTATGATTLQNVLVTLTNTTGGTLTWLFQFPAGVSTLAQSLELQFNPPLEASAANTAMVLTLPAGGSGNIGACVTMWGFRI